MRLSATIWHRPLPRLRVTRTPRTRAGEPSGYAWLALDGYITASAWPHVTYVMWYAADGRGSAPIV